MRKLDIKSRGMKNFTLLFIFVLCQSATYAQRFVPVLLEGNDLMDQQALATGDIYDLHVFNNELVCGGKFTEFFGLDIANLATWDGENASAFEPLPSFMSSDRIANMITYNGNLVIAGRLTNYNGAAMLADSTWTSIGVAGGNFHSEIIEYNSTLYTYRDSILYQRVNEQWVEMDQQFSNDVTDVEVYEGKLFVAVDSTLCSYDGSDWLDYVLNLNEPIEFLSKTFEGLFATGEFTEGAVGVELSGILQIVANTAQNVEADISEFFNTRGKIYSVFGENILTESYNPAIGFMGYPSKYINLDTEVQSSNSYAPSDIEYFNGQYYAGINDASMFSPGGLHLTLSGIDYANLDNGTLQPILFSGSTHFHLPANKAGLYFPTFENQEVSTIYAASLWLYGITNSDTLVNANMFGDLQNLTPGPIASEFNNSYLAKYYRVWHIDNEMLADHQADFMNPNYAIPEVIANWPAHGNSANGEAYYLAPFVDTNANGMYEPELGDYPKIKGDDCLYFMLNDRNRYASEFDLDALQTDSLNIEVHVMAYLYQSDNTEVSHSLFMNYKIINRSENDYEKFRAAVWTDFDIGNSTDDYVGCDTLLNYYYGYNGDAIDQPVTSSPGYGNFPPTAGCLFLNQKMTNSVYYNIGTNPASGDPITDEHFYNFMNSTWKNGQHILWGGNGVSGVGVTNQEANYMFPSYPWQTDGNIWNEQSSGNPPGDRRMIGSGEEIFFGKGEEFCFDIAYVMARDTNALVEPQLASLQLLQSYIPVVQQFYNDQHFDCYKNTVEPTGDNGTSGDDWFQVYPNPGGDMIAVAVPYDGLEHRIVIYDAIGQLVKDMVITGDKPFQTIDTRGMANAMYMIALFKNDKLLTRKWLKISE